MARDLSINVIASSNTSSIFKFSILFQMTAGLVFRKASSSFLCFVLTPWVELTHDSLSEVSLWLTYLMNCCPLKGALCLAWTWEIQHLKIESMTLFWSKWKWFSYCCELKMMTSSKRVPWWKFQNLVARDSECFMSDDSSPSGSEDSWVDMFDFFFSLAIRKISCEARVILL